MGQGFEQRGIEDFNILAETFKRMNHRSAAFVESPTPAWSDASGSGDGEFNLPRDVAVDSSGNLYVADRINNRIQKFDSSGNFLLKWGTFGTVDGKFNLPFDVAVDSSDNVYVADFGNHRIQKFTSSGVFILKWGKNDG